MIADKLVSSFIHASTTRNSIELSRLSFLRILARLMPHPLFRECSMETKLKKLKKKIFFPVVILRRVVIHLLGTGLFVFASIIQLPAQNVVLTGAISGRVTDQVRAVVPGASVVLRNLETGVEEPAETNGVGLYRFLVVMPGTYSVTVSLKGFRDVQALVRVLVGNTTSQDIRLPVGARAEMVKVLGLRRCYGPRNPPPAP